MTSPKSLVGVSREYWTHASYEGLQMYTFISIHNDILLYYKLNSVSQKLVG